MPDETYECPNCRAHVPPDSLRCEKCGSLLAIDLTKQVGKRMGWCFWAGISALVLMAKAEQLEHVSTSVMNGTFVLFTGCFLLAVLLIFRPKIREAGMQRLDVEGALLFHPGALVCACVIVIAICMGPK
jgi:hypothetical protein